MVTISELSSLVEGDVFSIEDHFLKEDGFNRDSGYNGDPWAVADALKSLGYSKDEIFEIELNNKISSDLKRQVNEQIGLPDSKINYKVLSISNPQGTSIKVPLYNEKDFKETLELMDMSYIEETSPEYLDKIYSLKGKGYIGTNKTNRSDLTSKKKAWTHFDDLGIYGSLGKQFTYFSVDPELAISHGSDKDIYLLELDLSNLLQYRNIFRDPEASYNSSEEEKTFVVMGGVPVEAITKIYHLQEL